MAGLEGPNGLNVTDRISITLLSAEPKILAAVCVSARPLTSLGNEQRTPGAIWLRTEYQVKGDDPTSRISRSVSDGISMTATVVSLAIGHVEFIPLRIGH